MRIKVYEEKSETDLSFVVYVLPEDKKPRLVGNVVKALNTNLPKSHAQRIAPCEYEVTGFLAKRIQEHLEKHGYAY